MWCLWLYFFSRNKKWPVVWFIIYQLTSLISGGTLLVGQWKISGLSNVVVWILILGTFAIVGMSKHETSHFRSCPSWLALGILRSRGCFSMFRRRWLASYDRIAWVISLKLYRSLLVGLSLLVSAFQTESFHSPAHCILESVRNLYKKVFPPISLLVKERWEKVLSSIVSWCHQLSKKGFIY